MPKNKLLFLYIILPFLLIALIATQNNSSPPNALAATQSCDPNKVACNPKVFDASKWCLMKTESCAGTSSQRLLYQCKLAKKYIPGKCPKPTSTAKPTKTPKPTPTPTPGPPTADPNHIEFTLSDQTWQSDSTNQQGAIQKDKNTLGTSLKIAGTTYSKGIGVWAKSHLKYDLKNKCSLLKGKVGIDDAAATKATKGSINFKVQIDNKNVLFSSNEMHGGNTPKQFTINVKNIGILDFYADSGQYTALDYGDWVELKAWCDPTVFPTPTSTPTPTPTPTPSGPSTQKEDSHAPIYYFKLKYDLTNNLITQLGHGSTRGDLPHLSSKKEINTPNYFSYYQKVVRPENNTLVSSGWESTSIKAIRTSSNEISFTVKSFYSPGAIVSIYASDNPNEKPLWSGRIN